MLSALFSQPLNPESGAECAALFKALVTGIHGDRRRARQLGWRGVHPSGSLTPAWTCRVAGSPLVFGITFSGGEPFLQPEALADLAEAVHARGKDVMVYSGFTFEQLLEQEGQDPAVCRLLEQADILVDGPYVESRRNLELEFRGSDNQRLLNREAMRRLREARKAAPVAKADAGV